MPLPGRSLVLALSLLSAAAFADTVQLHRDHPDRYTVVKGDTLWDIASRFLRDPWQWANVWNKNEQIRNPHLIYPGDVIILNMVDGEPSLTVIRNEKLLPPGADGQVRNVASMPQSGPPDYVSSSATKVQPQVRSESFESAIPTIKPSAIAPFLTQPLVVGKNELKRAGYVTIGLDNRVALGSFSQFYARGLGKEQKERYSIFRPGKALKNPDSGEVLGYEATFLGDARLLEPGDPAKLEVVTVKQEILPTDRLLVAPDSVPLPYYYPRPPQKNVNGRILSALNGVAEFGPGTVVSISLGQRDSMEEGHVLRIMRHAGTHRDPITQKRYKLPDEDSGLVLVFRTFEKVSFGIVMNANRPIHLYDTVKTP